MGCDNERRNPDNWRLYHLLELEPPVTAKQVQWTFRKVTLRHHFYQAYIVLYDSERKSLYDVLGEDAVGFIHSGNWGPLIHMLGARGAIGLYCGSMILAFLLLIIFFAFLGARVDEHVMWSWVRVASPLFVLVILALTITAAAAVVSFLWKTPWEEGMRWIDRVPAVGNLIAVTFYSVFCFIIASEADKDTSNGSRNLLNYFSLPIVADVVYYLSSLVWRWPRRVRLEMEVDLNRPSRPLCYGFFVLGFAYIVLSVAQWVLIGQKIDRKKDISWYVVFIPCCFRTGLRVLEAFMRSEAKRTIGIKTKMGLAFDTLGAFFFNGMLLTSLYFVAVRMTRGKEEAPMPLALIPVYVALLYMLLSIICTLIYLLRKDTNNKREERLNNLKWSPTEPQTGGQSGPLLFRDFDNTADWDEIEDDDEDDTSAAFPDVEEADSGDYDDFDSDEEEELFGVGDSPHRATPYGVSAPPDEDARPYAASHTPSMQSTATERPPKRAVHHDPYDPKTDAAPAMRMSGGGAGSSSSSSSSSSELDEEEEEYDDFDSEEDENEDEDAYVGTELSSSATSSAFFTSSIGTPRR
ncbi:hypothetical protein DQ04_00351070 [Trypanosoma grayi]|uniref:hypothetical protein n=1 Tax=Trypanosoma grayi TaxID=71804 RepID=UPI0004F49AAE|nr:hypothetical protein DQ04_00351070 [Trypanosoma grayi]KEG14670.1 hypothetical protein DQ04_00351070 [Trypanosoma grayi]